MQKAKTIAAHVIASRAFAKRFARDKAVTLRVFREVVEEMREVDVSRTVLLITERDNAGLFKERPTNFTPNPRSKYSAKQISALMRYETCTQPLYGYAQSRKVTTEEKRIFRAVMDEIHRHWRAPLGLSPMRIPVGNIRLFADELPHGYGKKHGVCIGQSVYIRDDYPLYAWVHHVTHELTHAYAHQGIDIGTGKNIRTKRHGWIRTEQLGIASRNKTMEHTDLRGIDEGLVEYITIRTFLAIPGAHPVLGSSAESYRKVIRTLSRRSEEKVSTLLSPSGLARDEEGKVGVGYIYLPQRELLDYFIAILGLALAHVWAVTLDDAHELAFLLLVRGNFTGDREPIEALFDAYCGKGSFKQFAKIVDLEAQHTFLSHHLSADRTQREVLDAIAGKKPMLDSLLAKLAKQLPRK